MITISLCMIVKNEEDVLARCLSSAKNLVDEIIIIDTGSTDKTKEIALQFTDKIYDFEWMDDFSAARNYSFSKATMDYAMWLDADDIITKQNQLDFLTLKKSLDSNIDIVMLKYHTSFNENGEPTFSYYRERIIKNGKGYLWQSPIHEAITPYGTIIHSDVAIHHKKLKASDPDRNLRIFEKIISEGQTLDPRQQFYYARELYYHQRYEDAIAVLETFLDHEKGWVENNIEACKQLSYCYDQINEDKKALLSLFRSFSFDQPRAEICCDIGKYFFDRDDYTTAIFWYETALTRKRKDTSGGFVLPDCYDYIPYLQLCVCYDKTGDTIKANAYNEKAGSVKPHSSAYLSNKDYFKKKLKG